MTQAKRGDDPSRRRAPDGRYAVEQSCDGCGRPIHGPFCTDEEVCGNTDGPGFRLCGRKACPGSSDLPAEQRAAIYAAQRLRFR